MGLEEHWLFYKLQAFMVTFFGTVLFPPQSGAISFVVLPLVRTLLCLIARLLFPLSSLRLFGLFLCVVRWVVVDLVVVCIYYSCGLIVI